MTSSLTRSSARAESGRSESRPGVSPRGSISEKKATALNAVAFFVDFPPQLQACRSPLPQRRLESDAERCCGRDRCHSGGFLLRIMPPSWHPVPACTPRLRCRRTILSCSSDDAASIPKSGPEIKNRCTQEGLNGEKLTSIPKSEPEIKNRCSYKNRRRNYSSLQLRKLESDAEDRCRYESSRRNHSSLQRRNLNRTRNSLQQSPLQAKLFFFAASKIRI